MTMNVISHRTVRLSDLVLEAPLWANPREFSGLDARHLKELGESIQAKGIVDPLKVQRILVNGDIVELVIDGQRRVLAGREVLDGDAEIPVVDVEEEPCELTVDKGDELLLKALTTLEREGLSSYELAKVAQRMKDRGKEGAYIAEAIGKSAGWVSKILKAWRAASPKLMQQWRKGDITDEQFKELAEIKDQEKQAEEAKEVVQARKDGDKGEARMRAKEAKETARKESKDEDDGKISNGVNGINNHDLDIGKNKPVVKGPQLSLLDGAGKADKPKKPSGPARIVLEEMVGLTAKRPPVSDYVKGLMDGVRYALGEIHPDKFGKAWTQYISRIEGKPRKAKKRSAKKAVKVAASKPAPAKKAKAGKGNASMVKARKPKAAKTSTGKRKR